ncbi:MAG: hypothetical protein J6Y02_11710 [Pseudobutyrivibrio sp.]|nr:hypothetical protein [Pseudobutyrivibrio sp.]
MFDIGRELSRINNIKTLLNVLVRDVQEYCKEADKDDYGVVISVNDALESLEDASGELRKMQEDM